MVIGVQMEKLVLVHSRGVFTRNGFTDQRFGYDYYDVNNTISGTY